MGDAHAIACCVIAGRKRAPTSHRRPFLFDIRRTKTAIMNPQPIMPSGAFVEPHYTAQELAQAWKLDETTIRRIFQDEAGVLKSARWAGATASGITSHCGFQRPLRLGCIVRSVHDELRKGRRKNREM